MQFERWEPFYDRIIADLGIDKAKDEEAAVLLDRLLLARDKSKNVGLDDLRGIVKDKEVHVFGRGPCLVAEIDTLMTEGGPKGVLIAADGASSRLLERGLVPHLIVSDLDGKVEDQMALNDKGTVMVVHAHGDNMQALLEWVPRFNGRIAGTCQCHPVGHVLNFGGFTDGDRCAFMAQELGASMTVLVGFEQGAMTDETLKAISQRKMRKLDWAFVLLGLLDSRRIRFFNDEDGQV